MADETGAETQAVWLVSDDIGCILDVRATRGGARAAAEEYFGSWRISDHVHGSIRWETDGDGDISDLDGSYLEYLVAKRPDGSVLFPHWNICRRKVGP